MRLKHWRLIIASANIVLALAIPLITNIISPTALTGKEQFYLGIWVFILLAISESLFLQGDIKDRVDSALTEKKRKENILEIQSDLDQRVAEVQRLLRDLALNAGGQTELFFQYHKRKLHDLEISLRDACVKKEVQIDETMFAVTEWLLQSSFRTTDGGILRAVLPATDREFFFSVHPRMYFRRMCELVKAGQVECVKRLIVVEKKADLNDDRLRRLIRFHNATEKFECKVISRASFTRIVLDYKLPHLVVDFGVYGKSYVYKALTNRSSEIVGIYSRDLEEVADFTECFDACWNSGYKVDDTDSMKAVPIPTVDWVFGDELADDDEPLVGVADSEGTAVGGGAVLPASEDTVGAGAPQSAREDLSSQSEGRPSVEST